jgi:1-acyl-sn-glycerol-3-phosphate acyltransferase
MSSLVYGITRIVLTTPLTLLYRFRVYGAENWPGRGPAIIASNHASNFDPCLVGIAFPGQIRWMAKAELWRVPLLGWLITRLGAFPVRRGESDREAIRRARELLRQGWIVGMFPEGTRQREGKLGEAQAGVGLMALEPGVPVIPVRVRGHENIIRGGRPHRPRITVTVGPPVDLDLPKMSRGKAAHEASRRIMEAIAAL